MRDHDDDAIERLVNRPAVVVEPETSLRRVAEILTDESIGAVIVVSQPRSPGAPAIRGIVSERDVSRACANGLDPDTTQAVDVMTQDLAWAAPDEKISRVANRMLANKVRHVPIARNSELIGVVSERDILRRLVQVLRDADPQ